MKNFNILLEKYALDEQSFSVEDIGKIEEVKNPEPPKGFGLLPVSAVLSMKSDDVFDFIEKDEVDLLGSNLDPPFWEGK